MVFGQDLDEDCMGLINRISTAVAEEPNRKNVEQYLPELPQFNTFNQLVETNVQDMKSENSNDCII